jgi:hypothetical protein
MTIPPPKWPLCVVHGFTIPPGSSDCGGGKAGTCRPDERTQIPLLVRQNGRETTTVRPLSGLPPRFLSQFLGLCPAIRCVSVRSGMCRFAAVERSTQLRLCGRFAADFSEDGHETATTNARVAQPVEHDVANVEVAGSRPAARFHLDELTERGKVEAALLTPSEPSAGTMADARHKALTSRSVSSLIAAAASCEATQTTEGHSHPLATHLCGGVAARRPNRTSSTPFAAFVRALVDRRPLAFGGGVAGVGLDRPAGVGMESVRVVSRPSRLSVRRLELVRDPAGEPVPVSVARPSRLDVAGSGSVACELRQFSVRVADKSVGVPSSARVVLT